MLFCMMVALIFVGLHAFDICAGDGTKFNKFLTSTATFVEASKKE